MLFESGKIFKMDDLRTIDMETEEHKRSKRGGQPKIVLQAKKGVIYEIKKSASKSSKVEKKFSKSKG